MLKELNLKNVVAVDGKEYMLSTVKLPRVFSKYFPYETMLFTGKKVSFLAKICIANVTQRKKKQEGVTDAC